MGGFFELRWTDLVDIGVVAVLLWFLFHGVRRARARLALVGLAILGTVFLLANQLQLQLTARLLQSFFAVGLVIIVVVFQDDFRRLFEQIALVGMRRRTPPPPGVLEAVVRTLERLSRTRTGALLVIPGDEPLEPHTEGGVDLSAKLSEPLLLSLFDPNSPGHDGAVVLEGATVRQFAVHLPLSVEVSGAGTRHAAALGLAERCDALCIAVSEERGTISVARDGAIRIMEDSKALLGELQPALDRGGFGPAVREGKGRAWREALVAILLAAALWLLIIPRAAAVKVERQIPVTVANLPAGYRLETIEPPTVSATLSGSRAALHFVDDESVRIRLDGLPISLGRRTFEISRDDVEIPAGIEVLGVEPQRVRVSVSQE